MRTVEIQDLEALAGQELGVSDWLEISQAKVDAFADATGDFQWIHVDLARAAEIGGTIAHGYLTLSLIPFLNKSVMQVAGVGRSLNYGSDRVRYLAPVRVGRRVRMRSRILSAEPRSGGVQVKMEQTVEIEGEAKPACIAEVITLYFPA